MKRTLSIAGLFGAAHTKVPAAEFYASVEDWLQTFALNLKGPHH